MAEFKKILYATDFSDLSAWALDTAVYLARVCSAELHCLHVLDDSYQYWLTMESVAVPAVPSTEELVKAAEKQLETFVKDRVPEERHAVRAVLTGRPFLEIIHYARGQNIDLIVLGTHGRSGLSHVLMGSVAEKVVRKSPCAVLTVRNPNHPFEMP